MKPLRIVLTLPQTDRLDLTCSRPLEGRGAVETIVEGWAEELARRGHKVRIAVLGAFGQDEVSRVRSYEIAHVNSRGTLAEVDGELADVIIANSRPHHLQDLPPGPLRILFMHNPPGPFADNNTGGAAWPPVGSWNANGTELIKPGSFIDALESMGCGDVTVACSEWLAARIEGMSGVPAQALYPHIAKSFIEARRPERGAEPILLYSGRLVWRKGLADIAALAHAGELPGQLWVTDFVNTATPAPDIAAVRAMLKATPNVRLIPPARTANAMADLVARASVALVPSTDEPLGLVAIEALAAGTPVVAYDSGGLPETGTVGLHLVETGNVLALQKAINVAVGQNGLSQTDRQKNAERFSLESSTDRLLGVIEHHLA